MLSDHVLSTKLLFFQVNLDGVELNDYELGVSSFYNSNCLTSKLHMIAMVTVIVIVLSMVWVVVIYLMLSSVTRNGDDNWCTRLRKKL